MKDLYRNLDLAAIADQVRQYTLNLQDYEMITPTLARVCLTMSGKAPIREEVRASIASLFKGLASPVASSFRELSSTGGLRTFVGFVKASHEVRQIEDVDTTKMKAMASNLLMDETDKSLWEIRNGAGTKYLVKQGEEDLSELATSLYQKKSGLPTLAHVASVPSEVREFAAYVDTKMEEVQYGYVVASENGNMKIVAYDSDSEDLVDVKPEQLVEVVNLDGEDEKEFGRQLATAANMDRQAMVEYYRQAYMHSPDYLQKIIDMIDQHAFA